MIPQIGEKRLVNGVLQDGWPSYATQHQSTISLTEMGDRTISTQVRIDGDVVPNFDGWELEFNGERFVLPVKDPQAQKDNTTRNSLVDLVFQSWPIQQMKQYFFMSMSEVETGVAIPDQYNVPVVMPVESFVNLFNKVLQYYFGDKISMSLYGMGTGIYSTEPVSVEINYTYIWDVLKKFYDLFDLLWKIERDSITGNYIIKVGYAADEINDHDFEYGYKGGLLKFERQVQDESISNILLGRGGEKNLPYRYFKKVDPQNPNWTADPDAIPELANIYFDRIRDAAFRWYVRGWMQNPNCDQAYAPYPSYSESDIPEYSADDPLKQQLLYAFRRGKTDARFNPVEFVRDEPSIESYGERWGALENNDEIYPTIQNMPPWARVDNVIAVSEITTDDISAASKAAVTENIIDGTTREVHTFYDEELFEDTLFSNEFVVPQNKVGVLSWEWLLAQNGSTLEDLSAYITLSVDPANIRVVNVDSGVVAPTGNIPAGTYRVEIDILARNVTEQVWHNVRFGLSSLSVTISDIDSDSWKPTFDIWVKNIWNTTKQAGETDEEYALRVWGPILGDRVGNEAKVVFSDGFMAVSQDYEFQIASYPVPDNTKSFQGEQSAWKITLRKSDAEFNTTGLYIPNATTGGKPVAGDHFFFTGIDMPFQYVVWAEEAVCNAKIEKLSETSEINPTWVITLDKVRVHTIEDEDYGTKLADRLSAGCIVHTKDKRFTNNNVLSLRVQSMTYTWNEGDIVPNIEVVLSDKVLAVTNPISTLTNDMTIVKSTYARTSEIESVVRRVASPMFLKKTGEADRSESPTKFASAVSSDDFRQGDVGGAGWGHYQDGLGDSVLELDKLVVRKELRVNSLVANQIAYVGGKQINSAANIECTQVIETENGYNCYFDQKGGTVKNLFVVGDFAMGQMFDPANAEVRYYRCQVTEIGDNYITLSKTIKDGNGVPVEGDVIVQYGNASDSTRQYAIVKDVIGGGYERMISNLSTVSANGNEYYFAGRQSGSAPRWFVGDVNGEYAEWAAGRLNIKGTLIVRNGDGTYQAMTDYMAGVANQMSALQSQIDGQIQSWASGEAPTAQTEPLPKIDGGQVDPSTANFPASGWATASDREKHVGDIYVDDSTGQGYRYTKRSNNGVTEYYWTRITDEELASALQAIQALQTAVGGLEYLKLALPGSTLVQGGLVLTSLIQLGQTENQQFTVYSGINGTLDQSLADPTKSIASWFGGPMVDHELSPSAASYAKSLFRHDGSGYLSSGKIKWDALGNGEIPGVSWSGNTITIAGDVRLGSVSGDTVTSMLTLLRQISDWFGEDADHNIYVKSYSGNARVFYNAGAISSGGISTTGGGGGGSVNALRDWANYRPDDTTQVLGSNLGKGLKDSVETLQGYFTNGVANNAADSDTLAGHASTYYAHQVNLGSTIYAASNGIVSLPAYPTTLPASDVYPWAKASTKPSYTFSEIGSKPNTLFGYGITDVYFGSTTADSDTVPITLGFITQNVLTAHQSLTGYVNTIAATAESSVYECSDCDYVYNPVNGDPVGGIAPGTAWDDVPSDWVCPICGASKDDFSEGSQFVYNVIKSTNSSTITFGFRRLRLKNIDGVDDLKAIEALTGTSGLLRKTAINTWTLDTSSYLTGITSAMVVSALGYTPFNAANFTQANIKSTLGISDWALASTKPSYNFDEIGLKPLTLSGYGIRDAYINNGTIVLGANSITPLTQHQSLTGYVNAISNSADTARMVCPDCGYVYDPSAGDPDAGISPGTDFSDLPSDWECPICGASKEDFVTGNQFVSSASKTASSSTIAFTNNRITLADIDGANLLKGIQNVSGTTGVLKKTGYATWELDPNAFPTSARELTDADDLCYVDPDEGVTVIIDDPGVTGTVLWGAESANQVALSVNGVSKLLLKSAAIAGLESSISTLSGYFINGSARNALSLGGHNAAYFASASGLTALQEVVAGKQDTINDLANIRSGAGHGETAYGWGNHASAGYATQSWVNGQLALYPYQIVVNGDAFGSVNGTIELPDYPTTLPASDVYAWAKASTKPSYTFSEIGSKPSTLSGYGITDAYISNGTITLGSNSITPLTSHQSLSGYAHQVVVNGDAFEAVDSVIELPDYPTTLPASDVYAWAKAATKPTYTATEVGLGNVTNDAQVKRTEMGAASGVATLGTDGKIPASQLPSYVDDVLEYASLSAFPATGESGKIYVAIDTNKTYRWSGTTYTEISPSIVIGTTTGTAFDGGSGYAHVTDGDIHVTAALKTAWSAKYDLPSGGIPSTDLASAIQTSLGHGDTAYGWGDHALAGYFPATSFTQANIQSTLGISNWALAASKPSYTFSEIGSKPDTLLGYGITDVYFGSGTADFDTMPITLGGITHNVLIAHQSLTGYVNAIWPSAETDVYLCPDCDYFYDPAIGDPIGGIAAGTAFADLPSDWVCPICGVSKANFVEGGRQFVSGVSKSSGSSTVAVTFSRLALRDLSGANNLKAIEYASGSGLLKKNADGTWGFDANSYLTGITSTMVTNALGYTPFDSANFTQANIQSTLGISNWALAASKPSYAFSELSSHPTTLSGYGITDAAAASDLLSYLPLAGGTMTGQLVTPSIKIHGLSTDYAVLESHNGDLLIGDGVGPLFVTLTAGNYTSYLYTKADIDNKDGILASGISSNSARLDSIEDWILGVNADTVGLGLVENVALSTWAGSGNITTLGTITAGVWQGTAIAANKLAIDFDWVFVANAGVYDTEDYIHVN